MVMVGWEMVAATLVCFLAVPLFDPVGFPALAVGDPMDWLWIAILAFGCTVFAQDLANRLLRSISAYDFNLAVNFEPVYGIFAPLSSSASTRTSSPPSTSARVPSSS